jgi:DNA-binding response OmpR family regulator
VDTRARRILVIDDDHEILDLTSAVLRDGGYRVFAASSGREGIAMARAENPDLILLDINMDDLDGWEALRLLKMDEVTRSISVAMFSVRYDLAEKMEALKRSADDYIVKPFGYDELLERVARILGRGGEERGDDRGIDTAGEASPG